jgi:hypothetical protein
MFTLLHDLFPFARGSARRSAVRALRRMPAQLRQDLGIADDQIEAVVDAMMNREVPTPPVRPSSIIPPRLPVTAARAFAYPGAGARA